MNSKHLKPPLSTDAQIKDDQTNHRPNLLLWSRSRSRMSISILLLMICTAAAVLLDIQFNNLLGMNQTHKLFDLTNQLKDLPEEIQSISIVDVLKSADDTQKLADQYILIDRSIVDYSSVISVTVILGFVFMFLWSRLKNKQTEDESDQDLEGDCLLDSNDSFAYSSPHTRISARSKKEQLSISEAYQEVVRDMKETSHQLISLTEQSILAPQVSSASERSVFTSKTESIKHAKNMTQFLFHSLDKLSPLNKHLTEGSILLRQHAEQGKHARIESNIITSNMQTNRQRLSEILESSSAFHEHLHSPYRNLEDILGRRPELGELASNISNSLKTTSNLIVHNHVLTNHASTSINVCERELASSSQMVQNLSRKANEIASILTVIDDIAEQTNLLALNASIEAARAGEQGKGFAVVAEEVRKLAVRSSSATRSITELLQTIQTDASNASIALKGSETSVTSAHESISTLSNSLNSTRENMKLSQGVHEQMTNQVAICFDRLKQSTSSIQELSSKLKEFFNSCSSFSESDNKVALTFNSLSSTIDRLTRFLSRMDLHQEQSLSHLSSAQSSFQQMSVESQAFLSAVADWSITSEHSMSQLTPALDPRKIRHLAQMIESSASSIEESAAEQLREPKVDPIDPINPTHSVA